MLIPRTLLQRGMAWLVPALIMGGLWTGQVAAAPPASEAEMTLQHDMILQQLSDLEERQITIDAKIQEVLDILKAPCGIGTANDRFVPSADNTEVCDNTTGRRWQREPSSSFSNWQGALDHCASLNLNNGQTYHLATLADYQTLFPLLAPDLNVPTGPFSNVKPDYYWSATEVEGVLGYAWLVNFGHGGVVGNTKDDPFLAWCVRGG